MNIVILLVLFLITLIQFGQSIEIYLSTQGDDSNPGTLSSPVKTLSRAMNLLPFETQETSTIWISSGEYSGFDNCIKLKLPQSRVRLVGFSNSDPKPKFICTQESPILIELSTKDITLEFSSLEFSSSENGRAIQLTGQGAANLTISHCQFNTLEEAIHAQEVNNENKVYLTLKDCQFQQVQHPIYYGFRGPQLQSITLIDSQFKQNFRGFYVQSRVASIDHIRFDTHNYHSLHLEVEEEAIVRSVHIMNGQQEGLHIYQSGKVRLQDVEIRNNRLGVHVENSRQVEFENCVISKNLATPRNHQAGGGVLILGSTASFSNCQIIQNQNTMDISSNDQNSMDALNDGAPSKEYNDPGQDDGVNGGGVAAIGSTVSFTNTIIDDNVSKGHRILFVFFTDATGGGLYLDQSVATFVNGSITGNRVENHIAKGGGLYVSPSSRLTIQSSKIANNFVKGKTTSLGAGFDVEGQVIMTNCTVEYNRFDSNNGFGGGFFLASESTNVLVQESTIAFNEAKAGAVAQCYGGKIQLDGCQIHDNKEEKESNCPNHPWNMKQ